MSPEQEVDLRLAEPEDGSIVRIKVAYPGSPKTYTYAAVGFDGMWYLSGVDNTARRTWDNLISWFKNKDIAVIELQQATSWEDLI